MARQETIISVFVASPNDMGEERERLEEIVAELNATWSSTLGLRLELLKWETHAHPSMGVDAQDVINRQISTEYDLFIGIMGSKFGTPTGRYGSGTEEEFERARQRYLADPSSVEVMMYFKDSPFLPKLDELDDLKRALEFRNKVSDLGALYFKYDSAENFDKLLRLHLSRKVQDWVNRSVPAVIPRKAGTSLTVEDKASSDDDFGLLDAIDIVEEQFASMAESTQQMSQAIRELSERMNQRTEELSKVPRDHNGVADRKIAKRIVTATALDFDKFSETSSASLPLYKRSFDASISALVRATELSVDFGSAENVGNQKKVVSENVIMLADVLSEARESAMGFRSSIAALPRIATDFNAAKRRALASLDQVIEEFGNNQKFLAEVKL